MSLPCPHCEAGPDECLCDVEIITTKHSNGLQLKSFKKQHEENKTLHLVQNYDPEFKNNKFTNLKQPQENSCV